MTKPPDPMTDRPEILDILVREAVAAIDAGDVITLERLMVEHPWLLRERLDPGAWFWGVGAMSLVSRMQRIEVRAGTVQVDDEHSDRNERNARRSP